MHGYQTEGVWDTSERSVPQSAPASTAQYSTRRPGRILLPVRPRKALVGRRFPAAAAADMVLEVLDL